MLGGYWLQPDHRARVSQRPGLPDPAHGQSLILFLRPRLTATLDTRWCRPANRHGGPTSCRAGVERLWQITSPAGAIRAGDGLPKFGESIRAGFWAPQIWGANHRAADRHVDQRHHHRHRPVLSVSRNGRSSASSRRRWSRGSASSRPYGSTAWWITRHKTRRPRRASPIPAMEGKTLFPKGSSERK